MKKQRRIGANKKNALLAEKKSRSGKKQHRGLIRKGLLVIFIAAVCVFGGLTVYEKATLWAENNDYFKIKDIAFSGAVHTKEWDLLQQCGFQPGTTFDKGNLDTIKATLLQSPWINNVVIRRWIPDRVNVHITERKPVAMVSAGGVYLIDKEGVLLPLRGKNYHDLPLLSGIASTIHADSVAVVDTIQLARFLKIQEKLRDSKYKWDQRITQYDLSNLSKIFCTIEGYNCQFVLADEFLEKGLTNLGKLLSSINDDSRIKKVDLSYENLAYVSYEK